MQGLWLLCLKEIPGAQSCLQASNTLAESVQNLAFIKAGWIRRFVFKVLLEASLQESLVTQQLYPDTYLGSHFEDPI